MFFDGTFTSLVAQQRRGVAAVTTAELRLIKPELRFYAASNPARGMSEFYNGKNL